MDQSIHKRTVNLWGIREILHFITIAMYIRAPNSAYDAVYELRAHDQVVLFPASFTFMIKAGTKMDKACNGAKIKASRWRHDGDRSHLLYYEGKGLGSKYARLRL